MAKRIARTRSRAIPACALIALCATLTWALRTGIQLEAVLIGVVMLILLISYAGGVSAAEILLNIMHTRKTVDDLMECLDSRVIHPRKPLTKMELVSEVLDFIKLAHIFQLESPVEDK